MAFTVRELITDAYHTSGIVSPVNEVVTGQQMSDGLNLLNDLLSIKTANDRLIPYFQEEVVPCVVDQESYFIENLISIESITFNMQTVRFPMGKESRKVYFGTGRVDSLTSLPFTWHLERALGGARLFIYPKPMEEFPLKIWGKFSLNDVELNEDLSEILDRYYIAYLKYGLTEYICAFNNITLQPQNKAKLDELESVITDVSPMDLSITKQSTLQRNSGINWAYVNFPGWTT